MKASVDPESHAGASHTVIKQLPNVPNNGDDGGTETGTGGVSGGPTAGSGVQMAAKDPKLDHIARQLGMDRYDLKRAIHVLKDRYGLGGG